jgi:hypothetical protein
VVARNTQRRQIPGPRASFSPRGAVQPRASRPEDLLLLDRDIPVHLNQNLRSKKKDISVHDGTVPFLPVVFFAW